MNRVRILALLGCLAALFAHAGAEERNGWPAQVAQVNEAGQTTSWEGGGPLFFSKPASDEGTVGGFRPFFVRTENGQGLTTAATVLYPIFIYRTDSERFQWSFLQLINRTGPRPGVLASSTDPTATFDLWPFWFSKQTGSPETSYRALFPVGGTLKNRLWFDELSWVIWPLYVRSEKHGAVTTSTPWPILRTTRGTEQGFALWPLFGWRDRPERFHRSFFLWPLGWNQTVQPEEDSPPGTVPTRKVGFIPFYTRETHSGFRDENFAWPLFGYTDRSDPARYRETRYLWPFLVQGRGENHYVNRWAPIYTHSIVKGMDKTWVLWPLVRQANWTDAGVAQSRTQFLYLLYYSLQQRSTTNPHAAPADRTHFWPLFSKWDNGAGRRQFQLFSPLDVFFPTNDQVRESWTPLFAIYRYDERAADDRRWSVLWGALTWREQPGRKEFHLGPLLGWKRDAEGAAWRLFWFDFHSKPRKLPPASR